MVLRIIVLWTEVWLPIGLASKLDASQCVALPFLWNVWNLPIGHFWGVYLGRGRKMIKSGDVVFIKMIWKQYVGWIREEAYIKMLVWEGPVEQVEALKSKGIKRLGINQKKKKKDQELNFFTLASGPLKKLLLFRMLNPCPGLFKVQSIDRPSDDSAIMQWDWFTSLLSSVPLGCLFQSHSLDCQLKYQWLANLSLAQTSVWSQILLPNQQCNCFTWLSWKHLQLSICKVELIAFPTNLIFPVFPKFIT